MKFSVLVVDDDSLVNEFLTETLKRAGYNCTSVHSGEEALVELKKQTFDIVLTEVVGGCHADYTTTDNCCIICSVHSCSPGMRRLCYLIIIININYHKNQ